MTEAQFKAGLDRLLDTHRTQQLSAACRLLWPNPISWDTDKMESVFSFDTTEDMGNPVGWLHGGVMATIFDNGMGCLASIASGGCMVPTVSLNVNYLRPAPLVGRVFMRGKVLKPGNSLVNTSAELYTEGNEDKPFAAATAVYAILKDVQV